MLLDQNVAINIQPPAPVSFSKVDLISYYAQFRATTEKAEKLANFVIFATKQANSVRDNDKPMEIVFRNMSDTDIALKIEQDSTANKINVATLIHNELNKLLTKTTFGWASMQILKAKVEVREM